MKDMYSWNLLILKSKNLSCNHNFLLHQFFSFSFFFLFWIVFVFFFFNQLWSIVFPIKYIQIFSFTTTKTCKVFYVELPIISSSVSSSTSVTSTTSDSLLFFSCSSLFCFLHFARLFLNQTCWITLKISIR